MSRVVAIFVIILVAIVLIYGMWSTAFPAPVEYRREHLHSIRLPPPPDFIEERAPKLRDADLGSSAALGYEIYGQSVQAIY